MNEHDETKPVMGGINFGPRHEGPASIEAGQPFEVAMRDAHVDALKAEIARLTAALEQAQRERQGAYDRITILEKYAEGVEAERDAERAVKERVMAERDEARADHLRVRDECFANMAALAAERKAREEAEGLAREFARRAVDRETERDDARVALAAERARAEGLAEALRVQNDLALSRLVEVERLRGAINEALRAGEKVLTEAWGTDRVWAAYAHAWGIARSLPDHLTASPGESAAGARRCNRHHDCDKADREQMAIVGHGADHCPGPNCGPACPPAPGGGGERGDGGRAMNRKNKMIKRWGQDGDSRQVLSRETAAGTLRNLRAAKTEAAFLRRVVYFVKRHNPQMYAEATAWAGAPTKGDAP